MATKSVIDIDVNDAKFQAFLKAFADYKGQAEDAPKDWEKLAKAIGGAHGNLGKLTKEQRHAMSLMGRSMQHTGREIEKAAKAQGKFNHALTSGAKAAKNMGHAVKGLATAMKGIGLLGLGLAGAVAAAGSAALFGMGDAAGKVNEKAIRARQLGLQIGQRGGFAAGYADVFGSGDQATAFLQRVRGEQLNAPQFLANLGLHLNGNVVKLGESILQKARSMYREQRDAGANKFAAAQYVHAHIGPALSVEQIAQLGSMSTAALLSNAEAAKRSAKAMEMSARGVADWQRFYTQIRMSLGEAENRILGALGNPNLIHALSKALQSGTTFFVHLLESPDIQHALSHFGNWINDAVKFLESSKFHTEFENFIADVKLVGGEIVDVAKWIRSSARFLGIGPKKHEPTGEHGNQGFKSPRDNPYNWNDKHKGLFGWYFDKYEGPNYWKTNPANPANKAHAMGLYLNGANWRKYNNPGDIDPSAVINGKRVNAYYIYPTMGAGYRAMAQTLRSYHQDTIAGLMQHYNPKGWKQEAANVSSFMGIGENQPLGNLNNTKTMAKLTAAVALAEQRHHRDYKELASYIERHLGGATRHKEKKTLESGHIDVLKGKSVKVNPASKVQAIGSYLNRANRHNVMGIGENQPLGNLNNTKTMKKRADVVEFSGEKQRLDYSQLEAAIERALERGLSRAHITVHPGPGERLSVSTHAAAAH